MEKIRINPMTGLPVDQSLATYKPKKYKKLLALIPARQGDTNVCPLTVTEDSTIGSLNYILTDLRPLALSVRIQLTIDLVAVPYIDIKYHNNGMSIEPTVILSNGSNHYETTFCTEIVEDLNIDMSHQTSYLLMLVILDGLTAGMLNNTHAAIQLFRRINDGTDS